MDPIGNDVPLGDLLLPASILVSLKGDDGSSLKEKILVYCNVVLCQNVTQITNHSFKWTQRFLSILCYSSVRIYHILRYKIFQRTCTSYIKLSLTLSYVTFVEISNLIHAFLPVCRFDDVN